MRHRKQTNLYSSWLKIVKQTNPKTGRFHYSIVADLFQYTGKKLLMDRELNHLRDAWHRHFDPAGCRGSRNSHSWKFRNKAEAEQLVTMALLKWGDRYVA